METRRALTTQVRRVLHTKMPRPDHFRSNKHFSKMEEWRNENERRRRWEKRKTEKCCRSNASSELQNVFDVVVRVANDDNRSHEDTTALDNNFAFISCLTLWIMAERANIVVVVIEPFLHFFNVHVQQHQHDWNCIHADVRAYARTHNMRRAKTFNFLWFFIKSSSSWSFVVVVSHPHQAEVNISKCCLPNRLVQCVRFQASAVVSLAAVILVHPNEFILVFNFTPSETRRHHSSFMIMSSVCARVPVLHRARATWAHCAQSARYEK